MGQLDGETDRQRPRVTSPPVGGLHHAGPTAGDHREAGAAQGFGDSASSGILRCAGAGPCRAEDRHRLRHPTEVREARRSEEHTSELQSLMRISYAVFCLKKKKTK